MVFTLVSETQEWLNKRYEKELKEREEEEERRIEEAEEAERVREELLDYFSVLFQLFN